MQRVNPRPMKRPTRTMPAAVPVTTLLSNLETHPPAVARGEGSEQAPCSPADSLAKVQDAMLEVSRVLMEKNQENNNPNNNRYHM
jgi:hypothetical protein